MMNNIGRNENMEKFLSKQQNLIEMEKQAYLSIKTPTADMLKLSTLRLGVLNRSEAIFTHPNGDLRNFTKGTNIHIIKTKLQGIISMTTPGIIGISIKESMNLIGIILEKEEYWTIRKGDDTQGLRNMAKMTKKLSTTRRTRLQNILLGLEDPTRTPSTIQDDARPKANGESEFLNTKLNKEQKEAIRFALTQTNLTIIHGPPGTGKTTTIIEIINQTIKGSSRVMVCAQTNGAVDNIMEQMIKREIKMVRIGEPLRVKTEMQQFTLEACTQNKAIDILKEKLSDLKKTNPELQDERKVIMDEISKQENKMCKAVLCDAQIVFSTVASAHKQGPTKDVPNGHFQLIIIDEASQTKEMETWLVTHHADKLILAGDPCQLPPHVKSKRAAQEGMEYSMMERLSETYPKTVKRLTKQYRMNKTIMNWTSNQIYKGTLKADETIENLTLADLKHVQDNKITRMPLIMIDTDNCCPEHTLDLSRGNHGEIELVNTHIKNLIRWGVREDEIGVITPYKLQANMIQKRLEQELPAVEVHTIDDFQGREKESITISMVRSNKGGNVGFLGDIRRLTVALTRSKKQLSIIGDSRILQSNPKLQSLVEYIKKEGRLYTLRELIEDNRKE